jgi:hypothetical protein
MGQAREEGNVWDQYNATRDMLILMLAVLRDNPTASVHELHAKACMIVQDRESDEELRRKMEKDD